METDALDFDLPPDLIAQTPTDERPASRLMHYRRATQKAEHRRFAELPSLLRPGDLLVFNDTRVLPARFLLRKVTGGLVEGLFLEELAAGEWRVLLKNLGRTAEQTLAFHEDDGVHATVVRKGDDGEYAIRISPTEPAERVLARVGRMPLPPYIRRNKLRDPRDAADRERYQTVFARAAGAVAAPTAALHFSEPLLAELDARGVHRTFVTLHVGTGTFKPVSVDRLEDHAMHREAYSITPETADALNAAKHEGRRIVAVGTTAARVLESQEAGASFVARSGETGIFIYPPYRWKHVDALVTNFHLPRSTLIALVAALVGLDEQRRLYRLAIEQHYRFFSYGDAMLVE